VVAYRFKDITEFALSLLKQEVGREEAAAYVGELHHEVFAAYQGMDSSLKFPVRKEIKKEAERTKSVEKEILPKEVLLDLRGVACPINYVKAKMKLEDMEKEEKLLMYLDAGEPIQNVPVSLRNDGQDVMKIEEKENYFEVLVRKVV
jgi:sulfite reductase (ferredoxin)